VVLTAAAGLLIQRSVIQRQGIEGIHTTMRSILLDAESTRETVSQFRTSKSFDDATLKAQITPGADYRQLAIYPTVPVVAAWNAVGKAAVVEGYEFRVPAFHARNPKNAPTPDEERILNLLQSQNLPEYFQVDQSANLITFARPVKLTADCLMCHGDPAHSLSGDGKDILGFQMENWKTGDPHGAFILHTSLDRVDTIVRDGLIQTLLWLIPLSLAMGIAVYIIITKSTRRLQTLTESVTSGSSDLSGAAAQISAQSQNLARGASQQAGSLEETSAAAEQITAMARENGDSARQAAEEMKEVSKHVHQSDQSLTDLIASMSEINDSSAKIAKIIKVIDEISFQTNILALNAAVEAARAGEAGAGFAVVADEVRSLAQRSANAAKDTATLIEESLTKSNEGSAKLSLVIKVFSGIGESADKVKTLIDGVSDGSTEQTRGIEQVLRAIQEMDKLTQASAANAQEGAATSEELSAQAEAMNAIALELKSVVDG